jgi:hypothetical protein
MMGKSFTVSSFFSISSALAMPSVTDESGTREGSRPRSFHTGMPRRRPTQSCSAVSSAARAAAGLEHAIEPLLDGVEGEGIIAEMRRP